MIYEELRNKILTRWWQRLEWQTWLEDRFAWVGPVPWRWISTQPEDLSFKYINFQSIIVLRRTYFGDHVVTKKFTSKYSFPTLYKFIHFKKTNVLWFHDVNAQDFSFQWKIRIIFGLIFAFSIFLWTDMTRNIFTCI